MINKLLRLLCLAGISKQGLKVMYLKNRISEEELLLNLCRLK